MNALRTQIIAPMLESLFYEESHPGQFGSGLTNQIHHTLGRIAIGQEIIYEKHLVARLQIILAHAYIIRIVFGKRKDLAFLAKTTGSSKR